MREMAESSPGAIAKNNVLPRLCGAGLRSTPPGRGAPGKTMAFFLFKLRPLALICANLFDDEGEEIIPLAWRPRELAENCRRPPCPVRLVGAA